MVKQIAFQCRSPYLKDYREARDRLTPKQLMLVDYAFLPPDELYPSIFYSLKKYDKYLTYGEKLFEYTYEEEDTKLWIFREGFETLAGTERDLEKFIVNMAIENETSNLSNIFKTVMDLERRRYKWMKLSETQFEEFVRHLRSTYAVMILESELNELQVQVQEAAKEDLHQRGKVEQHLQQ
ncbi:hypothetical protein Cgig2_030875 [Carnegiea gigantea]|uniref:Uncharacterized protein n=1 Tax=Carnegiea gigantea TaxID=171969 RepID=A0A9Q1KH25_9CARY|nr:hypothetical protein Cgig2_030875 [Carnegiea gigantea]